MKKSFLITTLVAILIVSASIFAFGGLGGHQADSSQGDFQPLHQYSDTDCTCTNSEEITIDGTIVEINFDASVEITVEAEDGSIYVVHAGPIWLYDGVELEIGVTVSIEGKIVVADSESYVVLNSINVGGTEVVLRDEDGTVVWAQKRMAGNAPMENIGTAQANVQSRNTVRTRSYFGKLGSDNGFGTPENVQNEFGPKNCRK